MEERRKSQRKRAKIPVKFRIVQETDPPQISEPADGILRNLSLGGLAMETSSIMVDGLHISYNTHPSQKNRVYLQWTLPSGRVIKIVGETIWYERTSASKSAFVVGLRIREIAPEDYKALKEYVMEGQGDHPLSL